MCRLFAGIAVEARRWKDELIAFRKLAGCGLRAPHGDGWGIGWYPAPASSRADAGTATGAPVGWAPRQRAFTLSEREGHRPSPTTVVKEPTSAKDNKKYQETASDVASRIVVAHVRKASVGANTVENSQPFFDRQFIFVHNGEIDYEHAKRSLSAEWQAKIKGQSDSELYAYLIFQSILAGRNVDDAVREVKSHITKKKHTSLNFLMSDGEQIFAYSYASEEALRKRREEAMKGALGMEHYYTLYYARIQQPDRVLVCSEKLPALAPDSAWLSLENGELLAIDASLEARTGQVL